MVNPWLLEQCLYLYLSVFVWWSFFICVWKFLRSKFRTRCGTNVKTENNVSFLRFWMFEITIEMQQKPVLKTQNAEKHVSLPAPLAPWCILAAVLLTFKNRLYLHLRPCRTARSASKALSKYAFPLIAATTATNVQQQQEEEPHIHTMHRQLLRPHGLSFSAADTWDAWSPIAFSLCRPCIARSKDQLRTLVPGRCIHCEACISYCTPRDWMKPPIYK